MSSIAENVDGTLAKIAAAASKVDDLSQIVEFTTDANVGLRRFFLFGEDERHLAQFELD